MQDFKKLKIWEKAHNLTLEIYKITKGFPKEEQYGLTSQLRRACASIPTNIAEGCGRDGDKEFKRFLQIAMGSACEVEYLVLLTKDLKYIKNNEAEIIQKEIVTLKKMISTLIKKCR